MITCSNCGYENNSDDALSCSLCGKVFRKEVREDKEEQDKQPMSKAKKFYAEMKEEWKKEALDPTGVRSLSRGIGNMIKGIVTSKGKERIEQVLFLCALIIAVIIVVILDYNFKLREAWYVPGSGHPYIIYLGGIIWIIVYLILLKIFRILTKRKVGK